MTTLAFRNETQRVLWENELCGQISDGHWENARPMNHWKVWCNAIVKVDPANVGRSFWPIKDNYNFLSADLLNVISARMLVLVRLAYVFGLQRAKILMYCFDLSEVQEGAPWQMVFKGMPTYGKGEKYWDDKRAEIAAVLLVPHIDLYYVKDVGLNADIFCMADLKKELRDMKAIMKVQRNVVEVRAVA
jgi:hypothetical protein